MMLLIDSRILRRRGLTTVRTRLLLDFAVCFEVGAEGGFPSLECFETPGKNRYRLSHELRSGYRKVPRDLPADDTGGRAA